jgi:chemotaxis protein histidine kinase CheA
MSDSEIVQDFLVESNENLDRLDRDLVGLENNPQDLDALSGVFRTIHTIKGTCGFLGFSKLEKVAHVGENLLTRLRDGHLTLDAEITTALLSMVDAVRQMLKEIGSTGQDADADYPELRETLTRLQSKGAESAGSPPSAAAAAAPKPLSTAKAASPKSREETPPARETAPAAQSAPAAAQRKKGDDAPRKPSRGKIGGVMVERGMAQSSDIARARRAGPRRSAASGRNSGGPGTVEAGRRAGGAADSGIKSARRRTGIDSCRSESAGQAGDAGRRTGACPQPARATHKRIGRHPAARRDISRKINTIQVDTKSAVEAIGTISEVINEINGHLQHDCHGGRGAECDDQRDGTQRKPSGARQRRNYDQHCRSVGGGGEHVTRGRGHTESGETVSADVDGVAAPGRAIQDRR